MERLLGNLYRYHDDAGCTSYLAVGIRKAYMVDTGMGDVPLMPLIRQITSLPVELLLTHAHPDHFGWADGFDAVWLSERESLDGLEAMCRRFGVPMLPMRKVRRFAEGAVFDAGDVALEALLLGGHTPGSMVFGIPQWQALLSGDAIGSGAGVLMTLPGAASVAGYRQLLQGFHRLASVRYAQALWCPGHVHQAGLLGQPGFNPPCMGMVEDMIRLCEQLQNGQAVAQKVTEINAPDGWAFRAQYGKAAMIYLPENLR